MGGKIYAWKKNIITRDFKYIPYDIISGFFSFFKFKKGFIKLSKHIVR